MVLSEFIAIIGGLTLTFIIYLCIYFRIVTKNNGFELIDWFLLGLATFNGIGFSFVIWATYQGKNTYFWSQWLSQYDSDSNLILIYFSSNVILIFSTIFGWYLTKAVFFQRRSGKSPFVKSSFNESTKYISKKLTWVAWIMLIIAIIGYSIYTIPYGGFIGLLDYTSAIRSGFVIVNNPFSFLQKFGGFALFSSYIFYGFLIDKTFKTSTKKRYIILGFIISFFFSCYVLYTWVGRIAFVVHLITFILGYILYKNKSSVFKLARKIIMVFVVGLILIVMFDNILGRTTAGISIVELFAKELSFPFAVFVNHFNLQYFSWFKDIIAAPVFVLPMTVWSNLLNIETASEMATFMMLGANKGEDGITGSIPVDMITFSLIQGSVLGIIIVGLLWGSFLVFLQRIRVLVVNSSISNVIYANIVLNVVILSVLYGDPKHIVYRNFHLIAGLLLLYLFRKISFKLK
ncbi:O-antigen polymerase [Cytobacillus kochii]